jgi:hypothetical protein
VKRALVILALIAAASTGAASLALGPNASPVTYCEAGTWLNDAGTGCEPLPGPALHEEDPGWDCARMGNLTCGPTP